MKRFYKPKETENSIDISPLIDMVFILLIFFMVSTTFVKDLKVDIHRPKASSSQTSPTKSIKVFIDKNENIYLDDNKVQSWVLQNKVREIIGKNKSTSVLIVTDEKVSANKLIEVVDQCRLAGAKDVGVATELEI